MAESIRVTAPGGDYDIHISNGLLGNISHYLPTGKVVVITNTTLAPLYGESVCRSLVDATIVTMPDGEQFKTLDTVSKLYIDLVDAGLDRSGTVIALGGGVVGDTAGFAA